MISRTLASIAVIALLLALVAPRADADSRAARVKRGASGQTYTWVAGTC